MKAMHAIETKNQSQFYELCDQIAKDTETRRDDVVFYVLRATYNSALTVLAMKGR